MFVHAALWPCTWRSDVYVHGQGWEVDVLIAVSKVACHFFLTIMFTVFIFSIFVDGFKMKKNTSSSDRCLGSNNDEGCTVSCRIQRTNTKLNAFALSGYS